jgi:hypothetical protein
MSSTPYRLDILIRGRTRTILLPRCEPGHVGPALEHLAHHCQMGAVDQPTAEAVDRLLRALEEAGQ